MSAEPGQPAGRDEPFGAVLAYDAAGTERGNALKFAKPVAAHDADARAGLAALAAHPPATAASPRWASASAATSRCAPR